MRSQFNSAATRKSAATRRFTLCARSNSGSQPAPMKHRAGLFVSLLHRHAVLHRRRAHRIPQAATALHDRAGDPKLLDLRFVVAEVHDSTKSIDCAVGKRSGGGELSCFGHGCRAGRYGRRNAWGETWPIRRKPTYILPLTICKAYLGVAYMLTLRINALQWNKLECRRYKPRSARSVAGTRLLREVYGPRGRFPKKPESRRRIGDPVDDYPVPTRFPLLPFPQGD